MEGPVGKRGALGPVRPGGHIIGGRRWSERYLLAQHPAAAWDGR
uniref:Uncharacterized protein n=1 Tax=Oryza nivara TaxID=4536 RepID=A0A0E0HXL1_ORYNI